MRSQLRAVLGGDHRDAAEDLQAAAEIVALERRVGIAPQRGGGGGHRAGFGLDLRLELDRRIGEVVALKRLLGDGDAGHYRQDGSRQKGDERGKQAGANGRKHG